MSGIGDILSALNPMNMVKDLIQKAVDPIAQLVKSLTGGDQEKSPEVDQGFDQMAQYTNDDDQAYASGAAR